MSNSAPSVVIIGAGIGGLAAALRLAHAGLRVTVLERHAGPGGKMRCVPSAAGPIDAGPTVLTMKPVFDALFADVGESLDAHVTLEREDTFARHFWPDGSVLDLVADTHRSCENIRSAFGSQAASDFTTYTRRAAKLFRAFEDPMMLDPRPSQWRLTTTVLQNPSLLADMTPWHSLAGALRQQFSDPCLAQLFARYATYVGGLPERSPAILGLISEAERRGVWRVKGGMHHLARAIEKLARQFGATFSYETHVTGITPGTTSTLHLTTSGVPIQADLVLFNGDPRALTTGHLGDAVTSAVPASATEPRSLSAQVLSFAAKARGLPLAAHNILFADNPAAEYRPLSKGEQQNDPTLYICAEDRFGAQTPTGPERFEIIQNAPPVSDHDLPEKEERHRCLTRILTRLETFGLRFDPAPDISALTMPQDFAQMFPASNGSLYGRSPHGLTAGLKRPAARTGMKGLYLVGGGSHPGAGVPMATLSAKHAVDTILQDLALTSTSRPEGTPGGTSMASAMTGRAPSR